MAEQSQLVKHALKLPLHLIEAAAMHANSGLAWFFPDEFPECSFFKKVKENRMK